MSNRGPKINHLAYADDLVIFSVGNKKTIKQVMKQIKLYENASGQKLNTNKSFFTTASNAKADKINRIREKIGFMNKEFPGLPYLCWKKKDMLL